MTNLVKDIKKLITGQNSQSIPYITSKFVRFLEAPTGSWDDGDFDAACGTAPEDDLRGESGTQPTVSWEWEPREALKDGTLATLTVSREGLRFEGDPTSTGLLPLQAVCSWALARHAGLDVSLTCGRATKFDIPSPRNPSIISSCTGLAKFITVSVMAAPRILPKGTEKSRRL
jgi:hypothetical protein